MGFAGRLRGKIGPFWWWTLVVFLACRAADVTNMFVGLWLVPEYVGAKELGAVMPLAGVANMLAIPLAAFATAFRSEVSRLALAGDFGRLKTLLRGVFAAAAAFFALAFLAAHTLLPPFLARIRIEQGSLAVVITLSAFVNALAPVFQNTLQALGRFKEISLIHVFGAPVRMVVMLAAMPFRPLSGYFTGQGASPAFSAAASVFFLRRELSAKAEPYWTKEVARSMAGTFAVFLVAGLSAATCLLVETTVIRQRLSETDGAAYYVVTRFSDATAFLAATICCTIFPYAAKLASGGRDTSPLAVKAWAATAAFALLAVSPFFFFGREILSLVPGGAPFGDYAMAVPAFAAVGAVASFASIWTTAEIAARRFGYLKWLVPLELVYCCALWTAAERGLVASIWTAAAWMAAAAAARAGCAALHILLRRRRAAL